MKKLLGPPAPASGCKAQPPSGGDLVPTEGEFALLQGGRVGEGGTDQVGCEAHGCGVVVGGESVCDRWWCVWWEVVRSER